MANWWDKYESAEPKAAAPSGNWWDKYEKADAQEPPTLNANASGSAGAVNKKAEAIWGGSFDDWKKRKERDDAERARMVAESEAGNVGSRRAQEFQRQTAALNEAGLQRGEFDTGATVEMMRANAEKGVGGLIEFAGGAPKALADFYGFGRNLDKTNAVTEAGVGIGEVGRTRAEAAQPLLIERPDSLVSTQGLKYIAQQGSISLPQTGAGLAVSTVNPALGLGLIGASAGGAKFSDARAEGRDFWLATEAAAVAAATEAVPEMLPMAALSGRLLKYMPVGTAEKLAKLPGGRGAMTALAEGGSEVATELGNLAYEIQREGKQYTPDQVATRLVDSFAVGTAMGGVVGGLASVTGAGADAYERNRTEVERLAAREALQIVEKPRATTARILGPAATPDAAAGAQIADDAFRAAGVGTVAAADMAEQDALARDLDAATRDQLSSEPEIDRLLAGTMGAGDGSNGDAQNAREIGNAGGVAEAEVGGGDGRVAGRDQQPPDTAGIQELVTGNGGRLVSDNSAPTTLPDGSVFLPGNPAEIRQRLADAGSKWRGMAREIDGVQGVRFGRNAWPEVQGVVGGFLDRGSDVGSSVERGDSGSPQRIVGSVAQNQESPLGRVDPPASAGTSQPTQAAVAVDGRQGTLGATSGRGGGVDDLQRIGLPASVRGDGLAESEGARRADDLGGLAGTDQAGGVEGRVVQNIEPASQPAPPALRDLTARRTNSDTKFDERVHDLTDFIALNGGLDRSSMEAEGIDPANWNSRKARSQNDKFFGKPLFRKTGGMTLETLREKARDAGFRTDKDVLDLIGDSLGGRKTFTPAGSEYQMALADVARQEADAQARQQRVNALPLSVPETDADAYIASRETEFDAPADRDGADLADIESTLASVADTSPQQRASVVSLGHDYTAKLIELKRARAAGALNPDQQEAYIDLLERDRETGKVAGRPMAGIGNKTAYVDALMQGKLMPVQAFLDADNFKALNDKFGHDVGDDVIRLMADVVRDEFGEGNVFHRGGDEFLTQGMTREEVDAKMARVQDYLARVKMELPLSDGRTATLTGVGVSYGTGANEKAADDSLKQDKQRRKDAGLRFDRREGDDAGRVGPQSAGAGAEASGANSRDSSRAAAEGVGDERQNRTNLPDAGSSREVAGRRGDAERAPDDLGGSGPSAETVRGGRAGSREVSGGIAAVRSAISSALGPKFLRRLESQPWFHLVESLDQLPPDVRKSITGDDIAGFVLPDGRVYIIADSVGDNATGIVLHEVGVHFGMSGLPEFPSMLRDFKRMRARSPEVDRAYKSVPEDTDASLIDEEAFAYYVEQNWNVKSPLMTRIKDAIVRLLNRLGIPTSGITDALMRQALDGMVQAAREAADGAARGAVTVRDGKIVYSRRADGGSVPAVSAKFPEDSRLSNLSQTGASWQRIRENNPALRGKNADDEITIYRATVGDEIRPDDFVAVDKSTLRTELANVRERDGSAAKIVSKTVRVRDLLMGNDSTEFVYFPDASKQQVTRQAPPREGLGASDTDARITYSRKTPAEARAESAQKQADLGAQLVASPGQSFVYTDKFTDDWRGQTRKMRERIQDKLLSVRDAQKNIEQIRGAIEDAANVYRRENLMHGRVGDQRDKLQAAHVKPLIEAMAEAKVSPALLEDYLEARHAKERNEKIAATKGGMPDGASGMTTQQAEDFLQGRAAGHRSGVTLDPAMTRQVSRLGRKVYAITAETRRRLLDSGQITREAFDALENAYAAYVPLRGKDGTEGGKGRGTGKGIDVRGKPVLRAAGRGEGNRAQNILAEVIADAERSIINAEKLRVGRTLARLVLENPNPDVWAIEPVKTELKVSEGTPEEIYEAVKNLDQEEGTIIVKVKGKPYRIVIEDQRMADALKNMAVETVPEVIQYVAGLNRYFSAVLTRYNPSFVGVNMTRDLLFGMTGIWAEHGTAAAAKAAASYFPAMRAAWRDIQGKPPVNAMGRYAREFAEAGGKTYFGKLENVSDMSQRIGEEFKTFRQMAMPKFLGGEMSPVRALAKVARDNKMVQAIEAVNDTVENTLRLSVYAARREAGASIEQAAEYAKNISVNFNRRGSATSWLNALYLFFNAATQGAHRTLTLLKNPKVQGVLGGLAALQATSAMFLMGLDDEDGEPLWDSISSWDKQRNLILAIPIKREKGWGATVIKIPMPYGFNLFPYMGGRSVELARDLQEKPVSRAIADYTTDAVVGVAQAMSPIPFDDGWKAALPHWVRIFTVLAENKDDLGIPIRAGDQYDSFDKPRSASGRDDTPRPFKIAATALNRLGGGDDYTPPYMKFALDWAPEDLAYLFKTFAGGLGSNVVKTGTLTEKLIAGVPVNFKDVPVLSSFVSNVDQRQATSTRYYDHKDDIEREVARQRDLAKETGEVGDNPMGIKIARNKSGSKVKRGEGYELEGKPGSLFDTYKQAEKDISRIRDEMRAAFNDQSISYSERIREIDELKAEREEVQRELNAAWREQRKKRTQ